MARPKKPQESGDWLFSKLNAAETANQSSLLDVVDNLLNRGVVLNGDVVLGVANVDLIYVKLSVLLAAFDKVTKRNPIFTPVAAGPKKKRRKRWYTSSFFRYQSCTTLCMPECKNTPDKPNSDPRDREPADEAPETPTDEPPPVPVQDPPVSDPRAPLTVTTEDIRT